MKTVGTAISGRGKGMEKRTHDEGKSLGRETPSMGETGNSTKQHARLHPSQELIRGRRGWLAV